MPENWCVIQGNPIEGVEVTGPFGSSFEASDYAEREFPNETWWVTDMLPPNG